MPNSNRGLLPAGYSDSEDEFAEWDAGGGGDGNNFGGEGPAAAAPTPSREHPREEWRNKAFGDAAGIRPFQDVVEHSSLHDRFADAVKSGDADAAEQYLNEDGGMLDKDLPGLFGGRPVTVAAREGRSEVVAALLRRGASLRPDQEGFTPFLAMCAAVSHDEPFSEERIRLDESLCKCTSAFLDLRPSDVNTNQRQCQQLSALMLAARHGHVRLCRLLLEKGGALADARDSQGWTPLCFAADAGHGEVARLLLERGADPDLVTAEGFTASDLAGGKGYDDLQTVIDAFTKRKSLLSGKDVGVKRGSGDLQPQGYRRFSEVDNLLMGMHLSQYTTVFQEHAVTLEQFLSLNEADLENMKIDKVGVRKTILDNIADLHRGRWGDRSLGAVTPVDRQRGIYLSAPDCVAIAFNSKTHASLIRETTSWTRRQILDHPEILSLGKDVAGADKLAEELAAQRRALNAAADACRRLERTVAKEIRKDPHLRSAADSLGKKKLQWRAPILFKKSGLIGAVAVLAYYAWQWWKN